MGLLGLAAATASALALALAPPRTITGSTARGDHIITVRADASGAPVLPAAPLIAALGGTIRLTPEWAEITIAQQGFRFLLGAPMYLLNSKLQTLAAPVSVARDTLFLPFQ